MTHDEIIEMARPRAWYGKVEGWTFNSYEELESFAKLVAAKYEQKIEDLENMVAELQERQE